MLSLKKVLSWMLRFAKYSKNNCYEYFHNFILMYKNLLFIQDNGYSKKITLKRFVLIPAILFVSMSLQAQEKLDYSTGKQSTEFEVSEQEFYIEYDENEKSMIENQFADDFKPLQGNAALVSVKGLSGNFAQRKSKLGNQTSVRLSRIEPVLVYQDGIKQVVKGELNIQLKPNFTLKEVLKGLEFTSSPDKFVDDQYLVSIQSLNTQALFDLVDKLQHNNKIVFAEPNFIRFMKPHTNDTYFGSQWAIKNQGYLGGTVDADMDVDDAWTHATGTGIKVAIIDEGVDLTHPDLTPNLLAGYDATDSGSNGGPSGNDAHGTACAGIVAAVANNNTGVAGVAYNTKIIPVRIAYSSGFGWLTNDSWIAGGINWAWQNGADVLSNSWGGGSPSTAITNAVNNAVNNGRGGKGSVVLFSSGNSNGNVSYPATLSNVIAVGASSMCDKRKTPTSCDGENWWGSNYGSHIDVVAPGVKIYTTDISGSAGYSSGDYTAIFNGTSSACPNAAGVVALILSLDPSLTQQEAREILESNTDKVGGYNYATTMGHPNGTWNNEMGYGRVNALKAIEEGILGNIQLSGPNTICNSYVVYMLSGMPPSGFSVNWSISSNLKMATSGYTYAVVKAKTPTTQGSGFVKATINGTTVLQKNVWVGKPAAVTGLIHVSPFGCTAGEVNVVSGGGADQYEWKVYGGTILESGSNTYTGGGTIMVDPIDSNYGFAVEVRAKNSCGYSTWFDKDIPTECEPGGGGWPTPLGAGLMPNDDSVFYPNPAKESVFINFNSLLDGEEQSEFFIRLIDISGRVVLQTTSNQLLEQIDVSGMEKGVYILHLSNDKTSIAKKLLIQN